MLKTWFLFQRLYDFFGDPEEQGLYDSCVIVGLKLAAYWTNCKEQNFRN